MANVGSLDVGFDSINTASKSFQVDQIASGSHHEHDDFASIFLYCLRTPSGSINNASCRPRKRATSRKSRNVRSDVSCRGGTAKMPRPLKGLGSSGKEANG